MGENDLKMGIVRTPLEPLQTYLDDPLRVLRTIRFATRFDFKITEDIFMAAKDPRVMEALETKVSYERIGKEMDLMFTAKFPFNSVKYLYDFGIIHLLLKFPPNCVELQSKELEQKLVFEAMKLTQALGSVFLHIRDAANVETGDSSIYGRHFTGVQPNIANSNEESIEGFKEFQKNCYYSALLLPFYPFEYKSKNKMERVVMKVLQDSIKKSNEVVKFVMGVLPHVQKAMVFADQFRLHEKLSEAEKLEFAWYLRDAGPLWNAIFPLAVAQSYFESHYRIIQDVSKATSDFDI
jgi:tRNA nucleotidyltransferase (CCA-adding enzyme)